VINPKSLAPSLGYGKESMNKLYQGNCLEVMKQLPDNSIDFILTDLPYGTTDCKWDNIIDFNLMWKQIKRIRKQKSAVALFGTEPFSSYLRLSNIKEYKFDWVWNKKQAGNPLIAKYQPLRIFELIHIFYKHNYYPIKEEYSEWWKARNKYKRKVWWKVAEVYGITKIDMDIIPETAKRNPRSVFKINTEHWLHPTQKPVALMEYLIKTYTNEWELVLDFTCGSGSTLVACQNTNRKWIWIELDEKYFNIAKERIT